MMTLKIETTKYCNQSCLHCSYSRKYSSDMRHLSLLELKAQFETYKNSANYSKKFSVMLTGGEPLLNPEIFEIIDFLSKNGAKYISLATNGIPFINNNDLKLKLKNSKVNELIISLSSSNEEYQKLRLSNQELVIKELIHIQQNNRFFNPIIITGNYLIHGKNIDSMDKFISSISSLPLNLARFLVYNDKLDPSQQLMAITKEERIKLKNKVKKHNWNPFSTKIIDLDFTRNVENTDTIQHMAAA